MISPQSAAGVQGKRRADDTAEVVVRDVKDLERRMIERHEAVEVEAEVSGPKR